MKTHKILIILGIMLMLVSAGKAQSHSYVITPSREGKFITSIPNLKVPNTTPLSKLAATRKNSTTDDYYPFLNNSKWFTLDNTFEGYVSQFSYTSGDTIINDNHYYVIKYKIIKLPNGNNNPYSNGSGIMCYLREDITNKQVYLNKWGNKREHLLYDFNLTTNNKMPYDTTFTLTKIDTVEIAVGKRKRFTFQDSANNKAIWIEGVGNISDPFSPNLTVPNYVQLICSYQNNVIIYDEGEVNGVNCTMYKDAELKLEELELLSCKLYPNPTRGKFRVSVENEEPIQSVKILDLSGKILANIGDNLDLKYLDLNISGMMKGTYICVVRTRNKIKSFQVIKE
ncbi:MAG: T9SS type A sorting domain-containing protein [Paludibacter sp.]|nr:T9SS type A sorting domain-containing protein [Paludibacter sp.]